MKRKYGDEKYIQRGAMCALGKLSIYEDALASENEERRGMRGRPCKYSNALFLDDVYLRRANLKYVSLVTVSLLNSTLDYADLEYI